MEFHAGACDADASGLLQYAAWLWRELDAGVSDDDDQCEYAAGFVRESGGGYAGYASFVVEGWLWLRGFSAIFGL